MASLLPNGKQQFFNANGVPLANGKVYFYIPNTSTLKNTWQDSGQTILNTNPVILDAAGEAIVYGQGQYRQVLQDSLGNTIWDQLTADSSFGQSGTLPGFNSFLLNPTLPTLPPSGLSVTPSNLPAGQVQYAGYAAPVGFPAITATFNDNSIYDYYLNPPGSSSVWSIQTQLASNYTALPHLIGLAHVWRIYTVGGNVTQILYMMNDYPTVSRPTDRALTIDSFAEQFYIYNSTTNWAANTSVTYGELLLVTTGASAGNVYQVFIPGTTGSSPPTSTAAGNITDGTATLFYYSQNAYLGMFRNGQNGGIEYYFDAVGLRRVCHRTLLTGSPLGASAGTAMSALILNHIKGMFFHVIGNRVSSGTYQQGQKMIAGNYIWLNQTYGSNATAGSSPFSGTYIPGTSTVVDGSITWLCIANSYVSQQWFWYNVLRDFLTYGPPDSHDSYASTFVSLIARYQQCTGDNMSWFAGNSPQPSGSSTFYTYKQIFDDIVLNNMTNLYNSSPQFLAQVFQGNVNPATGLSYTAFFLEDNAENYQGNLDAAYLYGILNDTGRQATANSVASGIASGIDNLYDLTYNLFATQYGQAVSSWVNMPNLPWYPYMQAQFWPELYNVSTITSDQRLFVRYNVSQLWPDWFVDKGMDTFPDCVHGFIAACMWQDAFKAYSFIERIERYFTIFPSGGLLEIFEFAYYLDLKDRTAPKYNVLIDGALIRTEDTQQNIVVNYTDKKVFGVAETANFTLTLPANAFITGIFLQETAGNAITGGLDIGTSNGGQQVVAAQAVGGSSIQMVPQANILKQVFSTSATQTLYCNAHGSWDSASLNIQIFYKTLQYL